MTDKKLTDSEIVKDLNEAEDLENVLLYCKNPNKEVMTPIKITDIRDLINRLQAENERLFADNQKFLSVMLWGNKKNVKNLLSQIKAEAYKECIEKVKETSKYETYCDNRLPKPTIIYHITEDNIDNLLKEMVGEDE